MMTYKSKSLLLNILCLPILAYILFVSWQQLLASTNILRNDYKTFYRTLRGDYGVYKKQYYAALPSPANRVKKTRLRLMNAVNLNTPAMNTVLKWLVNLGKTISQSTFCWTLVSLLGAVISVFFAMKYVKTTHAKVYYFIPALLVLWISWPGFATQVLGQVSFLLLPVLMLAFYLQHINKPGAVAVLLGLIASCKLFFLLFLFYFLIEEDWRHAIIFLLSFLVFTFLPLQVFSWQEYLGFYAFVKNPLIVFQRAGLPINGSVTSIVMSVLKLFHVKNPVLMYQVLYYTFAICLFLGWVAYCRRIVRKLPVYRRSVVFASTVIMALALSPLGWVYYYIFLLIPIVLMMKVEKRYNLSSAFYICLHLALVLPVFSWLPAKSLFMLVTKHLVAFAALCFFMAAIHLMVRCICASDYGEKEAAGVNKVGKMAFGYSLLTLLLLMLQYGSAYFIYLDKNAYLSHQKKRVWVLLRHRSK